MLNGYADRRVNQLTPSKFAYIKSMLIHANADLAATPGQKPYNNPRSLALARHAMRPRVCNCVRSMLNMHVCHALLFSIPFIFVVHLFCCCRLTLQQCRSGLVRAHAYGHTNTLTRHNVPYMHAYTYRRVAHDMRRHWWAKSSHRIECNIKTMLSCYFAVQRDWCINVRPRLGDHELRDYSAQTFLNCSFMSLDRSR